VARAVVRPRLRDGFGLHRPVLSVSSRGEFQAGPPLRVPGPPSRRSELRDGRRLRPLPERIFKPCRLLHPGHSRRR
jgi:hypothetical protein